MDTALRERWRFFHRWAGYATPPGQAVCALRLARAEAWAEQAGVLFAWEPDDLPWDGDTPAPEFLWGCVATLGDENASLWGIGDPSPEYRRVVQAELALELQTPFFDALRQWLGLLD